MSDLITHFTSLPNLHPAVVHFPIALLPVAVLVDLWMLGSSRGRDGMERAASLLYVAAALGAGGAYWAGRLAADGLPPLALEVQHRVNEHSDAALGALWWVALLAVARVAIAFWDRRCRRKILRASLLVVALVGVGLVLRTADLGGGLVYRYGVAVAGRVEHVAQEETKAAVEPETTGPSPEDSASRLVVGADGSLTWKPLPGDRAALGGVLRPAPGTDAGAVSWEESVDGAAGLLLAVDGEALLLLPGAFGDVQVQAELEVGGFEGEVGLAHHASSGSQAGLLTVSFPGNTFALVSRHADETRQLSRAVRSVPRGSFQLMVTADGRHFNGFLGSERIVHGHELSSGSGGCGLFLKGHGTVRILSLMVTPETG